MRQDLRVSRIRRRYRHKQSGSDSAPERDKRHIFNALCGRPGFYLARRVTVDGRRLGVIVLKVEFEKLEARWADSRSEEHTSELQSLMSIAYAVFCLKKNIKKKQTIKKDTQHLIH